MGNRQKQILVSPELLEYLLQLSNDVSIVGAKWNFDVRAVRLYIASPNFSECLTGEIAPVAVTSCAVVEGKTIPKVHVEIM